MFIKECNLYLYISNFYCLIITKNLIIVICINVIYNYAEYRHFEKI